MYLMYTLVYLSAQLKLSDKFGLNNINYIYKLLHTSCAGGYFSVPEGDASILLRQKDDYDGAEPAPSSITAANLFILAALCSTGRCKQCALSIVTVE